MALWGGRFKQQASTQFKAFNDSLPVDFRLAEQDIVGSVAWSKALLKVGVAGAYYARLRGILEREDPTKPDALFCLFFLTDVELRMKSGASAG